MLQSLIQLVDSCSSTTSLNSKKEFLERVRDDETAKYFLKLTYNFFVNLYLTTPPKVNPSGARSFAPEDLAAWTQQVRRVSSRQSTPAQFKEYLHGLFSELTPAEVSVLTRVVKRDLKCGINVSTINKVIPDLIPEYSLMGAHPLESLEDLQGLSYPVSLEPKLDGFRGYAELENNQYAIKSKNGLVFASYTEALAPALHHHASQRGFAPNLDGEVVAGSYSDTSSARKKGGAAAVRFVVFDYHNPENDTPYSSRREQLEAYLGDVDSQFPIQVIDRKVAHCPEDVVQYYAWCLEEGYEGIIIKTLDHVYERKRSRSWMKLKPTDKFDAVVVDLLPEKENSELLGSFVVEGTTPAGISFRVNVPARGNDQKTKLLALRNQVVGKTMAVKSQGLTQDKSTGEYSLRFARFDRFRNFEYS